MCIIASFTDINIEWLITKPHVDCVSAVSVHFWSLLSALLGPINREMRHLISSLQNHNLQLKGDVQRYKRKLRETQMEINKVDTVIHSLVEQLQCFDVNQRDVKSKIETSVVIHFLQLF